MTPKLEEGFIKDYPELFKSRRPGHPFHFDCRDGWADLLHRLTAFIASEVKKVPEAERDQYYVVQVKEKFGGLRYYMNRATKDMLAVIGGIEDDSWKVCEVCGETQEVKLRQGGVSGHWLMTLCERDWTKEEQRQHTSCT